MLPEIKRAIIAAIDDNDEIDVKITAEDSQQAFDMLRAIINTLRRAAEVNEDELSEKVFSTLVSLVGETESENETITIRGRHDH